MSGDWIPNWADLIQRVNIDDIGAMLIRRDHTAQEDFCFDHQGITTALAKLRKHLQVSSSSNYDDQKEMFRLLGLGKPERCDNCKGRYACPLNIW